MKLQDLNWRRRRNWVLTSSTKRKCCVCWVAEMEKEQLIEIANTIMPFGKYKGRRLIDLPEEYLLWFARKDEFPAGKLGELMQITLLIKTEGLTQLVQPLKRPL
ncbi:putative cytoplasmic protein [Escherichia coli TA447]|uniref:Putative cytoplasmic protein n=1 Tax=Escherichia coli TA447 TaxID=656447 RepID=A0A1X3J2N7_ECOLX|nr:putative cytoplasmic protein [Escherichia coli M718]OSK95169.1 putative cytoplasmic protein [Escherichia coli TA447]